MNKIKENIVVLGIIVLSRFSILFQIQYRYPPLMEYKKGVKSLDHVNLNIDHGIYGLLGENGAGKTTLMKILVTLLTPTSGTAEINGLTVEPKNFETIKKQIGYLPQEFGLYPNLTVRESLEYVGIMSGVQFMKSLQSKMFILWTERSATLPERW